MAIMPVQGSILPWQDIPCDSRPLHAMAARLGAGPAIEVALAPARSPGASHWVVDELVKRFGGRAVAGWRIMWIPDVLVRAVHHCIWQIDDVLFDVTPMPMRNPAPATSFVCDDRIAFDPRWPMMVADRHLLLADDRDLRQAIHWYRRHIRITLAHIAFRKTIPGISWSPAIGWTCREDLSDAVIERDIEFCDRVDASLGRSRAAAGRFLARHGNGAGRIGAASSRPPTGSQPHA